MDKLSPETCLAPSIIDHRARETPDRIFAQLPKGETLREGFFALTYSALAKAVNHTAWWLDDILGHERSLAYIGENDFRYALIVFASVKTRRQLLVPFPANTQQGMLKLLDACGCQVVLGSGNGLTVWETIKEVKVNMKIIEVPGLDFFSHEKHDPKPYPYRITLEEGRKDLLYMLQTSGTVGFILSHMHLLR